MILFLFCLLTIITFLVIEFGLLLPRNNGLLILVYHKFDAGNKSDRLTLPVKKFDRQLRFLKKHHYNIISISDLLLHINQQKPLPRKCVLITIDDGTVDNLILAYPLLKHHHIFTTFFLVSSFIGKKGYLSANQLRSMDANLISFGIHSHAHVAFNSMAPNEINADLQAFKLKMDELSIRYFPVLAYPYGAYPKRKVAERNIMFDVLRKNNITIAFRLGNRKNRLPLQSNFELFRTDIRGTDSMLRFVIKLRRGRSKMFT